LDAQEKDGARVCQLLLADLKGEAPIPNALLWASSGQSPGRRLQ